MRKIPARYKILMQSRGVAVFELCETIGSRRVSIILFGENGSRLSSEITEDAIAKACGRTRGLAKVFHYLPDAPVNANDLIAGTDLVILAGDVATPEQLNHVLKIPAQCKDQAVPCCLLLGQKVDVDGCKKSANELISSVDHILLMTTDMSGVSDMTMRMGDALRDLVYSLLGMGLIEARLQDLLFVMEASKYGYYSNGNSAGEGRALQAVSRAMDSWINPSEISAVLCHIRAGFSLTMVEIQIVTERLTGQLPSSCYVVVSTALVESMQADLHVGLLRY